MTMARKRNFHFGTIVETLNTKTEKFKSFVIWEIFVLTREKVTG
jgi:hypothetical protein